jgi:Flp pilus assembly protein TadD
MSSPSFEPEILLRPVWSALDRNDPVAAERICRELLQKFPDHPQALAALAYIFHAGRRFPEAEAIYRQLTALEPDDPGHWMNLGTARRGCGNFDEALAAYTAAANLGANTADFYFNVGLTHIDRNDFESGRFVLAQAVNLEPDDAEIRYQYALCCYERLRTDEALAALADWERLSRLDPSIIASIGLLLMKLGQPERAEPAVRRALQAAGSDPQPLLTLVQLLERTNRLGEAEAVLQRLVAHPQAPSLGSDLTQIKAELAQRRGQHQTARALYEQLIAECKDDHLEHLLQFPLAKSLDALGNTEAAFATLQAAHRSQAALLQLTAPMLSARGAPSMIITRYRSDPADIAQWSDDHAPPAAESPVFVVAFPRSGTTLLELTLDAHPDLVSMDEQPFIQNALDDMIAAGAAYPEKLATLTTAQLDAIRNQYWVRARGKVEIRGGQRLVDKNPLNILRLAGIKRLFPNAPIILAIRHPCDVILSCYMQHFRTPDFALLCNNLQTLTVGYRRSFDFWYSQREILAPRSMELRYESFVNDFDAQIRATLEFLQVPWSDAVLEPHVNARAKKFISTPSYSQVVERVNTKAVGRWRAYETHFVPVLPILEPLLRRWGYEDLVGSNMR